MLSATEMKTTKKISWSVIRKKRLYIPLPLFCATTSGNFQKLSSYTFYGGNVASVHVHFFWLPLFFTSVAVSISHFLIAAIKN